MKYVISAGVAAMVLLASITPVSAQSRGDDSQVTQCKTELDQQKLAVRAEKASEKQAAAGRELAMAQDAMERGNPTECLVHLQKVNDALK